MSINDVKESFDFLVNEHQGGRISAEEFNRLFHDCQIDYYNFLKGHIEQFQPGRPVPRIGLGMGDIVRSALAPFTTTAFTSGVSMTGFIPLSGVDRLLAVEVNDKETTPVDPKALKEAQLSTLVPISECPRYLEMKDLVEIYGVDTITSYKLTYLRKPAGVKWNYTIVAGREAYSEAGSIHPEWKDADINRIIGRMLRKFGIPYKDAELLQMGENIKNTGE